MGLIMQMEGGNNNNNKPSLKLVRTQAPPQAFTQSLKTFCCAHSVSVHDAALSPLWRSVSSALG